LNGYQTENIPIKRYSQGIWKILPVNVPVENKSRGI